MNRTRLDLFLADAAFFLGCGLLTGVLAALIKAIASSL